jgi:dTDP-4-amino-4,6-dideoxygalactose transaminase
MSTVPVSFCRPDIDDPAVAAVVDTLRSGSSSTGRHVQALEDAVRTLIHSTYALVVNSVSAALHLALEALGTKHGDAVLLSTMSFVAAAEALRHLGATPVLVDCDSLTLNMDLTDAVRKVEQLASHTPPGRLPWGLSLVGLMPAHVAGLMMDVDALRDVTSQWGIWTVEDAAQAFPAAWRRDERSEWQPCGDGTATITCLSLSAPRTISAGECGMIVTNHERLYTRMRRMSVHGLSGEASECYSGDGELNDPRNWDYKVVAPGFHYNMADVAAALELHQLARAEQMRERRQRIAERYADALCHFDEIELPPAHRDRIHAWQLFPIQLRLPQLTIDRAEFVRELARRGVTASVHWRPLHLHPYYQQTFGWRPEEFPVATAVWQRLVSLPIFSAMTDQEIEAVIGAVADICTRFRRAGATVLPGHTPLLGVRPRGHDASSGCSEVS